jgi:hypothetical protein
MSKVSKYGQMVKEILELGSKSAILADTKSKLFCKKYAELASESPQFLKALSKEHGLKTDKLYSTVNNFRYLFFQNKSIIMNML